MEAETTETPWADVTDEGLLEAYDHAVGESGQRGVSPEYREWWSGRADALLHELERRGVEA